MSDNRLRVLLLAPDAFGGNGGVALYTRFVLRALCSHPACDRVTAFVRHIAYRPEALPGTLTYRIDSVGGKFRYASRVLAHTLAHRRYDLIVCSLIRLLPIAYLAHLVTKAPIVLWIYGIDAWVPDRGVLVRLGLRHVIACVSIREWTTRKFRAWARADRAAYFLLPNTIEARHYGIAPKKASLMQRYGITGTRILMTMGRHVTGEPQKGVDEVLDVLPDLVHDMGDLMYLVVGGGSDLPRLRKKARDLGIDTRVVFTGYVSEEEKADHIRLADVLLMPGSHGAFDRYPRRFVFLEALACGVPVVASRPEDEEETGSDIAREIIFVDPTSRDDIAAGIRRALQRGTGRIPPAVGRLSYEDFERAFHGIFGRIRTRIALTEQLERRGRRP